MLVGGVCRITELSADTLGRKLVPKKVKAFERSRGIGGELAVRLFAMLAHSRLNAGDDPIEFVEEFMGGLLAHPADG